MSDRVSGAEKGSLADAGFSGINTLAGTERGRFFTKPPCGLNLLRREEHGNTFAHEIEHFIGVIGIPAKRGRNYKIRAVEKIPPLLPDYPNREYKKAAYLTAAGIRMQFRYRQVQTKATSP